MLAAAHDAMEDKSTENFTSFLNCKERRKKFQGCTSKSATKSS